MAAGICYMLSKPKMLEFQLRLVHRYCWPELRLLTFNVNALQYNWFQRTL